MHHRLLFSLVLLVHLLDVRISAHQEMRAQHKAINNEMQRPMSTDHWEGSGTGPSVDDEDGDIVDAEVEGSGAPPSTTPATHVSTTTTRATTIGPPAPPPTHSFGEPKRPTVIEHPLEEEDDEDDDEEEDEDLTIEEPSTKAPIFSSTLRPWEVRSSTASQATTATARITTTRPAYQPPVVESTADIEELQMLKPGVLAAISGGSVIGILMAILVVMFIVYRMRKKDEGSYSLDEPHQPPNYSYAYQKANTKEFYA